MSNVFSLLLQQKVLTNTKIVDVPKFKVQIVLMSLGIKEKTIVLDYRPVST